MRLAEKELTLAQATSPTLSRSIPLNSHSIPLSFSLSYSQNFKKKKNVSNNFYLFINFWRSFFNMTQDVEMKELPAPSNSVSAAPPSTLQRKINLYIELHIPISVYIALIFAFGVLDYRLNFGY